MFVLLYILYLQIFQILFNTTNLIVLKHNLITCNTRLYKKENNVQHCYNKRSGKENVMVFISKSMQKPHRSTCMM